METNTILRDKLHRYIDVVEDTKLQAIYTLLENEIDWHYSSNDIEILKMRRENHKNNTSKSYTINDSLRTIRNKKQNEI